MSWCLDSVVVGLFALCMVVVLVNRVLLAFSGELQNLKNVAPTFGGMVTVFARKLNWFLCLCCELCVLSLIVPYLLVHAGYVCLFFC